MSNPINNNDLYAQNYTPPLTGNQPFTDPNAIKQSQQQGVAGSDTVTQQNTGEIPPGYRSVNGEMVFQTVPTAADSPQLAQPSTAVNFESLTEFNLYFNSTALTALTEAMEFMALALQKQKIIDKTSELKLSDLTYKMAEASAELTVALGHLEKWEHIWKGMTIIAAGVATGLAAQALPRATQFSGANQIMFFEMAKSLANAASEFVSAGYAVPKATLQALKQLKDQVIQLISSAKESSAALAKEDQDNLDRILQSISDMIQKLKRAYEVSS